MRLTRRGWATLAIVVIAVGSGIVYGPRGLNAIAAPGVVALLAAVLQVYRADRPAVDRTLPGRGYRGETVRVRLHVDVDRPIRARVRDRPGAGLAATGNAVDRALDGSPVTYDLELASRGSHDVGPASIEVRDVLGLVAGTFEYADTTGILVWPRVHPLAGAPRTSLATLYGGAGEERRGFDHLRTYERGDPLRDIHWPTSAKQPDDDLVVKHYASEEGARIVQIAATADAGRGDAMADAAASIAVHLLRTGVQVGVTSPSGRIEPGGGSEQRTRILDHLATADAGDVAESSRRAADVVVRAREAGTRLEIVGRHVAFTELAGPDRPPRAVAAGADA